MQLEVYKKSDFYEDYISSQKEYYERENADAYFAERLAEKDKKITDMNRQIEFLKLTHSSCGDCNKCADGMGKVFDENLDELKQKLENVQASMYCDVVDANMENRRLKRALWIARALRARDIQRWWIAATCAPLTERACSVWNNVERKCRAKAEEYK